MPKESGRKLADQLGPKRPQMKVLFMSGYTDHAVVNSGLLSSDSAFIQKPFTPTALTRKVRDLLHGSNGQTTKGAGQQ
jgi:two-component system cell cycle sensor histidine kinase/response regulator CckA